MYGGDANCPNDGRWKRTNDECLAQKLAKFHEAVVGGENWICSDVWMDILPFFRRRQLGFKMALLSDRFDVLVDAHFDGKSELTLLSGIRIRKNKATAVPELRVFIETNYVGLPLPKYPLPSKIRFDCLAIKYIDHSVLAFLRANQQIWDKTNLECFCQSNLALFATNIRHLNFSNASHLINLLRLISPTILTLINLIQLNSIGAGSFKPNQIDEDFDELDATADLQNSCKNFRGQRRAPFKVNGRFAHETKRSFVRAFNAAIFAYDRHDGGNFFRERKLDISIPPLNEFKGGPSYSAAAFVAMMSISTGRTIRTNWTVTGEVTINGHVEAIGGVRAKTLAAIRAGMKTIVLPRGNLGDFRRIEKKHRSITAIFVDHTFDLLQMLN
ncbi:hypothetical protein niasHT_019870 [Heterodera trifolii]|uniref:Lon proteolytic domain-containing protein n=1 Tax=Heterodera trifolii TaxID=157864 RepID=A0ABD2L589_9BILA